MEAKDPHAGRDQLGGRFRREKLVLVWVVEGWEHFSSEEIMSDWDTGRPVLHDRRVQLSRTVPYSPSKLIQVLEDR